MSLDATTTSGPAHMQFDDNRLLPLLFGEHDQNLSRIEKELGWSVKTPAYQEKMDAAERILGNRMTRPEGGFFLWLEVGNGEEFALKAWRDQGVRLLPGAYMGREINDGKTQSNPGFSYVRIALVNDLSTILTALERVRNFLDRR